MMRTLTAVGATLGLLLAAPLASATVERSFGDQGQFIFSADRLVPLFAYTNNQFTDNTVNPSQTSTVTGTSISLLWGSNSAGGNSNGAVGLAAGASGNPTFYTTPRLGFDYVIVPNVTVGGDLFAYFTLGGSTTVPNGANMTRSTDNPSGNAFGVAPRGGYVLGLSGILSLWLRGGVHFYTETVNVPQQRCNGVNDSLNAHVFGLDIDPQLVISPIDHFAFLVGPALDWGFAGGASYTQNGAPACNQTTTTNLGYTSLMFGATGSIMGWF